MTRFLLDTDLREERYNLAEHAEKGEVVICPSCGDKFTKKRKSQKFCGGGCKIKYHNRKK